MDKFFKTQYSHLVVTKFKDFKEWEEFFFKEAKDNPSFSKSIEANVVMCQDYLIMLGEEIPWDQCFQAKLQHLFWRNKSITTNFCVGYPRFKEALRPMLPDPRLTFEDATEN